MLNFMHLESLRAVLDTGSLSAAGKKLGYTTSAVSQQISALERTLGVQLFERGPRNLWPTAAAQQVNEAAAHVLAQIADFEETVRAAARQEHGRLRIASFTSASSRLLPRALAELIERFPDADFPVAEQQNADEVIEAIASMRADLGLVIVHPERPTEWPEGIVSIPVFEEDYVVLAGRGCSPGLAPMIELASLSDAVWAAAPVGAAERTALEYWCASVGFTPKVMFESENHEALRGMIRENLALGIFPALAMGVDRNITMHRLSDVRPRRRVHIIYRETDQNPLLQEAEAGILNSADDFISWTGEGFETDELRMPIAARLSGGHPEAASDRASTTVAPATRKELP